jgi:TatD DNase family protein
MIFFEKMKLIDIAINLTDPMYKGIYRGKQIHQNDFLSVLERASKQFVDKMIVTGVDLESSLAASELKTYPQLYSTAGIHPTHSSRASKTDLSKISSLITNNIKIVAIGECGLDYDRLHFATAEQQKPVFLDHFELSNRHKLPMFLHSRNAHSDFVQIINENLDKFHGGVVHSFTGSLSEMQEYVEMGLYIGINGCSMKTAEQLEVIKLIPNDRLLLETDGPWCGISTTHASFPYQQSQKSFKKEKFVLGEMVKSRNEPCTMVNILRVVAALKSMDPEELADIVYANTLTLFRL